MKILSLLFVAGLFFNTAFAQDTTKVERPKPNKRQFWHHMIMGPKAIAHDRMQHDSLANLTRKPEPHHPAIYGDAGLGYAFLGVHGLSTNISVNYQDDAGLFTLKGLNILSFRSSDNPYLKHPSALIDGVESNSLDQVDFMYGKRILDRAGQYALIFSAGVAVESRYFYTYQYPSQNVRVSHQTSTTYPGVPIEINYQVFSRRFGASLNLKLSGDISRNSFASFGVALGLGYHYKN